MIPKALTEITWSDLEALRDSGREESDTIEFKESFSGGPDFLALSDSQREKAVKGIAREAIAFLNGRGGDIIVGAVEADNDHPSIKEFRPLANVSATADRLAQVLSATVEPYQAVLGVRAIRSEVGDSGVIVIRAPASLRAPHRYTRDRECYIRRGRESVPMPMDEIQDLTIYRSMARAERNELLDRQFFDLGGTRFWNTSLDQIRSHFRLSFVPDQVGEVELQSEDYSAFFGGDPRLRLGEKESRNEVAFRNLSPNWRPQLRGKVASGHYASDNDFTFCSKSIKQAMVLSCDFALSHEYENRGSNKLIVDQAWIAGFCANALKSIKNVLARHSQFASGTIRIATYFAGNQKLITGEAHWEKMHDLPSGTIMLPDFRVDGNSSFGLIFEQFQVDICAIAGAECHSKYVFVDE